MDNNVAQKSVSGTGLVKSTGISEIKKSYRKCILCWNNYMEVVLPVTQKEFDTSLQELSSSLCRLIQLPTYPFVDYFLQENISFCPNCTRVLRNIHRQLENLKEIQKQLDQLKNAIRSEFLPLTPRQKRKGKATKLVGDVDNGRVSASIIRGQISQTLEMDKSARIDLNGLVHVELIDDDIGNSGTMDICETEIIEFDHKPSLLNPFIVATPSRYEGLPEEDVKVFASEVEGHISGKDRELWRPKRNISTLNNQEHSSSDDGSENVDSDWVPVEKARKSGKILTRQKRRKVLTPKKNIKNSVEYLKCPYDDCNRKFNVKLRAEDRLAVHVRGFHEGVKTPFQCPQCSESFTEKVYVDNHVRKIHTGERPFVCEVCGKTFRLKRNLKIHCRSHEEKKTGASTFQCTKCPRIFSSSPALRSHISRKHLGVIFMCELCSVSYYSNMALKDHQRQVHFTELGLNPHQCGTCHKIFSTQWVLRDHQRTHTGEGLLQCPNCDIQCPSKAALKSHMRKHASEKPFKCDFNDECGATFRYSSALTRHLRVHKGEKPFKCSSCPKTFISSGQLRNHEGAIHSGLTPFECEHCGEKFPIRKYWQRHLKKHLNGKLEPKVGPSPSAAATTQFVVPPFTETNYGIESHLS